MVLFIWQDLQLLEALVSMGVARLHTDILKERELHDFNVLIQINLIIKQMGLLIVVG